MDEEKSGMQGIFGLLMVVGGFILAAIVLQDLGGLLPHNIPVNLPSFGTQRSACDAVGGTWNANDLKCSKPIPVNPNQTPSGMEQCLAKGGTWNANNMKCSSGTII